jgi:hypothetical protein
VLTALRGLTNAPWLQGRRNYSAVTFSPCQYRTCNEPKSLLSSRSLYHYAPNRILHAFLIILKSIIGFSAAYEEVLKPLSQCRCNFIKSGNPKLAQTLLTSSSSITSPTTHSQTHPPYTNPTRPFGSTYKRARRLLRPRFPLTNLTTRPSRRHECSATQEQSLAMLVRVVARSNFLRVFEVVDEPAPVVQD